MNIKNNYTHTIIACYIGYVAQATINNFAPLLFLTFHGSFGIELNKIALLVTVNFGVQLTVDFFAAKYVDKIGYKTSVVVAHFFIAAGLFGLGVFPSLFPDPFVGILAAIVLYAIGGGITEVLISAIVEGCPTKRKSAAMSLLHSFYCWGHVFVILMSTLFFVLFGIENWPILAMLWAIIPLLNAFYFIKVPIAKPTGDGDSFTIRGLFKTRVFLILVIIMICSGAAEQSMSQWASAFAEAGLNISKTAGDLAGPCMFAILMGTARVFYSLYSEKLKLQKFMFLSTALCIIGYLLASLSPFPILSLIGCAICGLSVGILWPGTISIASGEIPRGGTPMFALLALAGDLGCAAGPAVVGFVSESFGDNLKIGLQVATIFPVLLVISLMINSFVAKSHAKTKI